jgi:hypothetical protein
MQTAVRTSIALALLAMAALFTAPTASRAAEESKGKEPPAGAATTQPGPLRFYGTISAVDAAAKTFTIDNQTYVVVPESQLVKAADDKPATFADAIVGETARGSYTKTSDGKLNVTKVRFGKKAGGGGKAAGKKNKEKDGGGAATAPAATKSE